jgi:hypothetical protein
MQCDLFCECELYECLNSIDDEVNDEPYCEKEKLLNV